MSKAKYFPRLAARRIATALDDTPVVMVHGPRQCGKTTLVREFSSGQRAYFTLDEESTLQAARSDPAGFVRGLDRAIIDEVQRAPDLLRAIKKTVDEDRRPCRFLLTGSANVLTLPTISESLAGRMEVVTLLPLARAEISGTRPAFLEDAFAGKLVAPRDTRIADDLVDLVLTGGYPEMLHRTDSRRRQAWAREYVNAIVRRDAREATQVERLDQMPRLLRVLAHHSGQLTNFSQMGGQIGLDDKTTRTYVGVLEQLFLVARIAPWSSNQLKRLVKTAKLHFLDSGLLAALQGTTAERIGKTRGLLGPILETFVFAELMKQITWMEGTYTPHHFRDRDQDEVDIVVEDDAGAVVGVEVKASATVRAGDFRGLRKLAEACGQNFKLGVVMYDGDSAIPFGERLFAAPVSCLWA